LAAAEVFNRDGVAAAVLHAGVGAEARRDVLALFEKGRVKILAAPKLLDEGVDVPTADLAIVIAASRSRLQMVQRMGRVLRRKPDNRLARLAIFCVQGTPEDPASGGHEAFLDLIIPAADRVETFEPGEDRHLCSFLNAWTA
jgi:superfamily II DNA or RNA helicase